MVDNAKYMICYRLSPARETTFENKHFTHLQIDTFTILTVKKNYIKFLRPLLSYFWLIAALWRQQKEFLPQKCFVLSTS